METQETTTTSESKQITIEVPAERLAEFYAFFGHFLAGWPGRRRHRGHRGHHGRHCGPHRAEAGHETASESETAGPGSEAATA
jgi:hypothetical protein